ncbi:MAG: lysophospholipid acyltransferase family protein [Erythrobacter sp.]|uniref:lysophospholipid acyltransferase family protein n=1 Tax=Erythrobacter sp. TaxID=1042 RepID=UPI00262FBD7D|nr:lysophospholipid acyltransferase family protein [Erythrobacter sp.]MDJ0979086.1 lysophospholipid acyltransferase family protein [Erythrobacter sp.]
MPFARSLLFYPVFYGFSALLVVASVLAIPFGRERLRGVVATWGRWHRWCLERIVGIKVVLEGTLPDGPVLIAVKHESYFEAIDMPRLFRFPTVFAKRELFLIPGWGYSARIYGLIPVARDKGARALREMIKTARERVAEGRPLVIFPEGTRVEHGSQPPLQSGFAGTYKLLGLPVVPIAVNSGPVYHRLIKRPGTITYRVGETIPAGLKREEIETRVHAAINALNA